MFVVYHKASTMKFAQYRRRHHAQSCVNRKNEHEPDAYAFAHRKAYNKLVVYQVERTNMMSGKKYLEPSNTPNYCSPSSEAYWSM